MKRLVIVAPLLKPQGVPPGEIGYLIDEEVIRGYHIDVLLFGI